MSGDDTDIGHWANYGYYEALTELVPILLLSSWIAMIIAFLTDSYVAFAIMISVTAVYFIEFYPYWKRFGR